MVKVTTTQVQCDFCLRKVSEHAAYIKFGYMSDGAGTFHDFCDAYSCMQEAREIAGKHVGIQVWWPRVIREAEKVDAGIEE